MEKEIVIYHNPKCSKSREAISLLEQSGKKYSVKEYLKEIPTELEIKELLSKLNLTAEEIMRKGEDEYKTFIKGKNLSEEELIHFLNKYPRLIERPIVIKDQKAIIGRPPSLIVDVIN